MQKSNGTKVWILEAIVGVFMILIFGIGSWWFANASDTLKNVVTHDDVNQVIEEKIISREEVSAKIQRESPYIPDKARLENVIDDIRELKTNFKEFKNEQKIQFREFTKNQDEIMRLIIQMKTKLDGE